MKKPMKRLNLLVASCAVLILLPVERAFAAGSQLIPGHVPAVTAHLQPLRHLEGTNVLKLAIGLPWRDKPGLTNLLQQIYDPTSPNYHKYLTVAQFTERFGPTPADYEAVVVFATSHHLRVTGAHRNRALVDVEGAVGDIEKALNVTMQVYQHPTEHREFYAPDRDPSVDLNTPLLHISGLDSYNLPHPLSHKVPLPKGRLHYSSNGGTNAPLNGNGSGPSGTFLGYDFRNAYIPGVALTGVGQNAGLVEFDAYYTSDILNYEQQAGLPNETLVNIPIDGGVSVPGGGVGEVSLDIEMVMAMAPGISTIYVYEAPNPSPCDDILNRMATDDSSKQLSSSWGLSTDPTSEQIFQEFGAQGQSFYQASGDSDAYVGVIATPEDDPNITLVGGTELVMNPTGASFSSESVWNNGFGGAPGGAPQFNGYWGSGGGISTVWSIPTWQQGISMVTNQGSTSFRNTPDVALTADNIWVDAGDSTQDGDYEGTSCAAPLWCGFTALVNQQAAANGESSQGFINPAVYSIGKSALYSACFHDTVTGNNIWPGSSGLFSAVPGYDLCTGWGTPAGSNLINTLAPPSKPILEVVTNIISGGNGSGFINYDECADLTIILTNVGAAPATGVTATLYSTTTGAIVAQGRSAYPLIQPGAGGTNETAFTLSTEPTFVCGTPVNLTMVITSAQVTQTNYLQLPSGILGAPVSFTNSTSLSIPIFSPVSSPVVVSGLQDAGKITVSVYLQALYDAGISMTLIAPNGTNVLLSQFNGGYSSDYGVVCATGGETVFDDAATFSIADPIDAFPPYLGSYQPQQPLSVFHLIGGTNLNGVWKLEISDDFPDDTATLGCWSLNVSPEVCTDGGGQCPGAALSLAMSANPSFVYDNNNLVYTLTVSNGGPSTADNIVIIQNLPAGVIFQAISNSTATATLTAGSNLDISLGSLPVYGTATLSVVTAIAANATPGVITSTATAGAIESNPNPANSTASASATILAEQADIAVGISASPSTVLQGGLLTYTITVTNNGPFVANDVFLDTSLPASDIVVSSTESDIASANLGGINVGASEVETIVVTPTNTGNTSATAVVALAPPEQDPITLNNTASVSTTVQPAADLSVTNTLALPSPVVAGSNLTYIITVSNAAFLSPATGVTLSQSIPTGSTFLSNNVMGSTTVSNSFVNVNVTNNLAAGASMVITDVFQSPTLFPGVKSNSIISTIQVFGQPADPNTNNNSITLLVGEEPPTVNILPAGVILLSGGIDGSVGTNGTYTADFYLENEGNIATPSLTATLLAMDGIATSPSGAQTYGVLQPEAPPTAGQFTFTTAATNGGVIAAVLQWQAGTNSGMVTNYFAMPTVQSFWNTNYISIPAQDLIPYPDAGIANPYPSAIAVSNVVGDVSSVTVTVSNLFHSFPHDIGMLLVAPNNELSCVLMSAADDYSSMDTPLTITFDQSAALYMPVEGPDPGEIPAGSYKPSDYYTNDYDSVEFYTNSPDPVGPYVSDLSYFGNISSNGTPSFAPNGIWNLYVYDFADGDWGAVSNGWGVTITTITPINPVIRLTVSTIATNLVFLTNSVSYQVTVANNGPGIASNVFLTNIISSDATLTNVVETNGTYTAAGNTVSCNLGTMAVGASNTIIFQANATTLGIITNIAFATAFNSDLFSNETTNIVTTHVVPPEPSLSSVNLAGGLLQLTVSGYPGLSWIIESSSNLVNWTPLLTNTGVYYFTDVVTNNPQKFYRVVLVQPTQTIPLQ